MIIAHGKLVANDTLEGLKKLFAGTRTLSITVKGDAEAVKEAAASMAGVVDVKAETDAETGYVTAHIALDDKADIREELSIKLAEMKMPVMSMVLDEKQLEDIFIELTGDEEEQGKKNAKRTKKEGK